MSDSGESDQIKVKVTSGSQKQLLCKFKKMQIKTKCLERAPHSFHIMDHLYRFREKEQAYCRRYKILMFSSLSNSPYYSATVKDHSSDCTIPTSFLYNIYIMLNWFSSRIFKKYLPMGIKQQNKLTNQCTILKRVKRQVFISFKYLRKIKHNFNTNLK